MVTANKQQNRRRAKDAGRERSGGQIKGPKKGKSKGENGRLYFVANGKPGGQTRFRLVRSDRRTMEIAVHPDKSVVVRAPQKSELKEIKRRVLKRADWIARQKEFFEQFEPRTPPRQHVDGEEHLYLGKKYRLKIVYPLNEIKTGGKSGSMAGYRKGGSQAEDRAVGGTGAGRRSGRVMLEAGQMIVELPKGNGETKNGKGTLNGKSKQEAVRKLLENWYRQQAKVQFAEMLDVCWAKFQEGSLQGLKPAHRKIQKPTLQIRKMKTRWGSLSHKGTLTLNLDLIRAPRECLEYLVMHELCHLIHSNHSPAFYSLLASHLPDWTTRKQTLEKALA